MLKETEKDVGVGGGGKGDGKRRVGVGWWGEGSGVRRVFVCVCKTMNMCARAPLAVTTRC